MPCVSCIWATPWLTKDDESEELNKTLDLALLRLLEGTLQASCGAEQVGWEKEHEEEKASGWGLLFW